MILNETETNTVITSNLQFKNIPFTIAYIIEESLHLIVIIAVYHQKRNPEGKYR